MDRDTATHGDRWIETITHGDRGIETVAHGEKDKQVGGRQKEKILTSEERVSLIDREEEPVIHEHLEKRQLYI